jgi:hypothetical protein
MGIYSDYIIMNVYFVIYFILVVTYVYIWLQNKDKIFKNKDDAILNERQSILFETVETISLLVISTVLLHKQPKLAFMFIVPLIVHINQLLFCYRATIDSLQLIIILLFMNSILYSYSIKCYWVIYLFSIGIFLHVLSLAHKKPFMKIVCLNKKRRLQSS